MLYSLHIRARDLPTQRRFVMDLTLTPHSDTRECFELIHNTTLGTLAEPFFLSILQHLLTVRDDCVARCVRIQTCVSSQTRAANQTRASCQRRSQSVQGKMGEWRQNSSFL